MIAICGESDQGAHLPRTQASRRQGGNQFCDDCGNPRGIQRHPHGGLTIVLAGKSAALADHSHPTVSERPRVDPQSSGIAVDRTQVDAANPRRTDHRRLHNPSADRDRYTIGKCDQGSVESHSRRIGGVAINRIGGQQSEQAFLYQRLGSEKIPHHPNLFSGGARPIELLIKAARMQRDQQRRIAAQTHGHLNAAPPNRCVRAHGDLTKEMRPAGNSVQGRRSLPFVPAKIVLFSREADCFGWVRRGEIVVAPGATELTGEPGVVRLRDHEFVDRTPKHKHVPVQRV